MNSPFINFEEACHYLKAKKSTLRYWILTKKIKPYRVGRRLLFDPNELDQLVRKGAVK